MTIHRWPIRVYYEDVDLAGIVYYANYLRYIERARSELVRGLGIDQVAMREDGLVFAVTHVDAAYLSPARYDDELVVETGITARTAARCVMGQTVSRDGASVFRADVTIVCMTLQGRPRRLPRALVDVSVTSI
ncbi:MAG: tol-pal system-associated acyl-CoA thioesterase [Pseudomonadota bacterium]